MVTPARAHVDAADGRLVVVAAADDGELLALADAMAAPTWPELDVARLGDRRVALARDDGGELVLVLPGGAQVRAREVQARPSLRTGTSQLARAIGTPAASVHVVDVTAGLGRDSVELCALGYRVTAVERHPVLAAMLRASLPAVVVVREGDGRHTLAQMAEDPPDVVLVDPMFEPEARRAKARKDMQALQLLVGPADPAELEDLLRAALAAARRRVVVKRPRHAPPLLREPTFARTGRAMRLDVYVVG